MSGGSIVGINKKVYKEKYLYNKRIMGIDFGLERIGIAISDKLHIAISTEPTLHYSNPNFWKDLIKLILEKEIGGIVLGVPYTEKEEHPMKEHIEEFEKKLRLKLDKLDFSIPIEHQDENYTSRNAVNTMLEIGKKKKHRSRKGSIDAVAAGLILREWLLDNDI
jgi:putative Holliday junction resolvase